MDGEALKGCPFCGYVPAQANVSGGGPKYWVECYKCEASGPVTDGWTNVDRAWNHRPGEAASRSLGYGRAQADERAERDAAIARAELAEARLAKIVDYIKTFSVEAHERYMACDVKQPAHLTKYGAATALDCAASDIGRIATDPKPNRMVIDRAPDVR